MSGTSEVLEEYLVSLGFQTDAVSLRKFEEGLQGVEKKVFSTGIKVAEVIGAVEVATAAFAYNMRKAYFSAELSGTTVKRLTELEFAGKQIGISAEEMGSAVHGLAQTLRLNPGKMALLDSLTGVREEGKDATDQLVDLMKATKKFPEYIGAQYAEQFGIDADTYHLMRMHLDKLIASQKEARDVFRQLGVDPDQAKKVTLEYTKALDDLKLRFEVLGIAVMTRFEPAFKGLTNMFRGAMSDLTDLARGAHTLRDELSWIPGIGKLFTKNNEGRGADKIAKGDWMGAFEYLSTAQYSDALSMKFQMHLSDAQIAKILRQRYEKQQEQADLNANPDFGIEPAAPTRSEPVGPRNARNNNPGNLRYRPWQAAYGATGQDPNGFAIFRSPTAGFAAMQALLQSYGAGGVNTVRGIVNTYAPASDGNDVSAYIADIDKGMGVGADQKLDLSNPATVVKLSRLMARHEGLPSALLSAASRTRLGQTIVNQNVHLTQTTNINVKGTDAQDTARQVLRHQSRVNGDLVRNMKAAVS